VLVETLGMLGVCLANAAKTPDTIRAFLSFVIGSIPELVGPLMPASLDLALAFTEYMLHNAGLGALVTPHTAAREDMLKTVLSVLVVQRAGPSLRLQFSSALTESAVGDALLMSDQVLSGKCISPAVGSANWLQCSNIFSSSARRDGQSPWLYEVFSNLWGRELFGWVAVIYGLLSGLEAQNQQSEEAGTIITNSTSSSQKSGAQVSDGSSGSNLGNILYLLLETTLPSSADRWMLGDSDVSDTDTDTDTAISNFIGILEFKIVDMFSVREYAETCGQQLMSKAHAKFRVPNPAPKSKASLENTCFGSVAELATQLIDAASAELIDRRVHASAVAVLLLPGLGIPRQIQQTIWTKFGEERLLHILADSPIYLDCGVCFVPNEVVDADFHLISTIASELSRLRNPDDINLSFCLLGVIRIAQFVFANRSVITGNRLSLLRKMIASSDMDVSCSYTDRFVLLLFSAALSLAEIDTLLCDGRKLSRRGSSASFHICSAQLYKLVENFDLERISDFARSISVSGPQQEDKLSLFDLTLKCRGEILSTAL
jgi:hypothetical protein